MDISLKNCDSYLSCGTGGHYCRAVNNYSCFQLINITEQWHFQIHSNVVRMSAFLTTDLNDYLDIKIVAITVLLSNSLFQLYTACVSRLQVFSGPDDSEYPRPSPRSRCNCHRSLVCVLKSLTPEWIQAGNHCSWQIWLILVWIVCWFWKHYVFVTPGTARILTIIVL